MTLPTSQTDQPSSALSSVNITLSTLLTSAKESWLPSIIISNTIALPLHIGLFAYGKVPSILLNYANSVAPGSATKLTCPVHAGIYTLHV